MNGVKAGVAEIFRRENVSELASHYDYSKDGIPYALIRTQKRAGFVRYLFLGNEFRVWIVSNVRRNDDAYRSVEHDDVQQENVMVRSFCFIVSRDCLTLESKCKKELAEGIYTCIFNPKDINPSRPMMFFFARNELPSDAVSRPHAYLKPGYLILTQFVLDPSRPMMFFFARNELPSDAVSRPHAYLKPGYLILTQFVLDSFHAGIYIGNGKVVHVSGHGEGKSSSVARIGNLVGDFANPGGRLWVLECAFRFRSLDRIVEVAKKYAEDGFRGGEYNLLGRNCQHFASLCAFGVEYSFDANAGDAIWKQMWVTANCEVGYPS